MPDDPVPHSVIEILKIVAAAGLGALAKPAFDFFKGRKKEKVDTLQVSNEMLQEWMVIGTKANKRMARLEGCLIELLPIIEQLPNAHLTVERVKAVLSEETK